MDELTKAITMAGFFHDLGKFAERAQAVQPGDKDEVRQEYRYAHAHHTELALLELFEEARVARQIGPLEECSVLNMAARHHKPRNIYEIIVSEADRIASGHERVKADETVKEYDTGGLERKSKVPLTSILSRICLKNKKNLNYEKDWRYRICTIKKVIEEESIDEVFPVIADSYSKSEVQKDYRNQWDAYKKAIRPKKELGLDIFDHFRTIFEISRIFLWCIPATTRYEDMPDVSLFDHLKVTAALSACLYEFHKKNNTLEEKHIRNRSLNKYILFAGDISGIQKFIYQISSKGAYKTLKGRSFYIQILAEILANLFVKSSRVLFTNILYASGGKFYLLLPNTNNLLETLSKLANEINQELFDNFNGELYIRTGWKELSGDDLTRKSGQTLYQIWDELTQELIFNDRKRYSEFATQHYEAIFQIKKYLPVTCEVCHGSFKMDKNKKCKKCCEMESLGRQLGDAKFIAIGLDKSALPTMRPAFSFHGHHVWILDKEIETSSHAELIIYSLNDSEIQKYPLNNLASRVNGALFLAGSTHKFDETFDEIAEKAKGIKRLGILRMDVDDLGKIFSEGLSNYQHQNIKKKTRFHSIGRITTLSWQLSLFFSGIVPAIIRINPDWKDRVTVVYSGGDDFFILGAWDAIPHLALGIKEKFSQFTCHNNSFSLSGGMVITGGRFPIYKSAEMAGEAENKAKKKITQLNSGLERKSAFTYLDVPMHWVEFEALSKQFHSLSHILSNREYRSLLTRMREIYNACETCLKSRELTTSLEEIEKQILSERWQWLMVYSLSRFVKGNDTLRADIEDLQRFLSTHVAGTNRLGIELLGVLSRWCEFSLRNS